MAPVLQVGMVFKTFEEFKAARTQYEKEKNMKWVTKSSSSISKENKQRAADGRDLLNTALQHKNVVYQCKFGGTVRKSGLGVRCHQATYKIECPALLHLIAHSNDGLTVEKLVENHNGHDLTEDESAVLPENRKVHPDDEAELQVLLDARVKPCIIKPVMKNLNSGHLMPRDIANYRAKRQRELRGGKTEHEMLEDLIADIHEADPDVCTYIKKDTANNLQILFIQTSNMRENVQKFGTVVLMDHTYKIDKNGMPLAVLMVMDGNGLGRVVGIAYVINEEKTTVADVLKSFRSSIGEEVAEDVQTIVIDKDYSEAAAIAEVFPNVSIQLCEFHVANTLSKASAKESSEVKKILKDLRHCADEDNFEELCDSLKKCATPTFWAYFEKNWKRCPLAWSFQSKKAAPNLGNNTTNRLENWNGKAKMVVSVDSSLCESLKSLLGLIISREEDVKRITTAAQVKRHYILNNTDPMVDKMVNELTRFAYDLILWEKGEAPKSVIRPSTTVISCDCSHYKNYIGLPCRHIIKKRTLDGLPWYDPDSYHPRWKVSKSASTGSHRTPIGRVMTHTVPQKVIPKSGPEKYTKAMTLLKKMANILSASGDSQFGVRFKCLSDIYHQIWAKGHEVHLSYVANGKIIPLHPDVENFTEETEGNETAVKDGKKDNGTTVIVKEIPSATGETTTAVKDGNENKGTLDTSETNSVVSLKILHPSNQEPSNTPIDSFVRTADFTGADKDQETGPGLFLDDLLDDEEDSCLLAALVDVEEIVLKPPPLCFCNVPAIRLNSKLSSKMKGNPFYKCKENICHFWQTAPKPGGPKRPRIKKRTQPTQNHDAIVKSCADSGLSGPINPRKEAGSGSEVLISNHGSSRPQQRPKCIACADGNAPSGMHKCNKCNRAVHIFLECSLPISNEEEGCGEKRICVSCSKGASGLSQQIDEEILDNSNCKVTQIPGANLKRDEFKTVIGPIVIPPSVKHKGRPKGLTKTNQKKIPKKNKDGMKRPRGVIQSLEERKQSETDDRMYSAQFNISDSDVTPTQDKSSWTVKSETDKSVCYTVCRIAAPTVCLCTVGSKDFCAHSLSCTCKDHVMRKRPCKHIYKIANFYDGITDGLYIIKKLHEYHSKGVWQCSLKRVTNEVGGILLVLSYAISLLFVFFPLSVACAVGCVLLEM